MQAELVNWAAKKEVDLHAAEVPRSLDSIAGEIVGARLVSLVGIGAPSEIRLVDADEARNAAPSQWICKPLLGSRIRYSKGKYATRNLLIKKIPGAISLVSLRTLYGIRGRDPRWNLGDGPIPPATKNEARSDYIVSYMRAFLHVGREHLDNPADFFADFVPPADWSAIQSAIQWDSEPMLKLHAARLFLGTSTAHAGNVMVDQDAKLYSIDHEFCALNSEREDLHMLAQHIQRNSKSWAALQPVAKLTERDIESLFVGLPQEIHWPMKTLEGTLSYYRVRLLTWKGLFGASFSKAA